MGCVDDGDDFNSDNETEDQPDDGDASDGGNSSMSTTRGTKHFITPCLLSALDNAKVSDTKAIHIIIATAEALGHNLGELVVNRSTLHRLRQQHRIQEAERIQSEFIDNVIC